MEMNPYLSFQGDCEQAFAFYARCLAGRVGPIFRYAGTPMADHVPGEWSDKIMHGSMTVGGQVLMGADVTPDRYERPRGFALSIQTRDTADAERVFEELGKGGEVVMPLEKTFWAERFGMLVDRFGVPWMINCAGPDQSQQ